MTPLADGLRWDGWIHLIQDGHDIPRGPLGVLAYLPLAVLFWYVPRRWRASYLTGSGLFLAWATLGPAFALTLIGLVLLGLLVVRTCGRPQRLSGGLTILGAVYAGFLLVPRPAWLPPIDVPPLREPTWFYLHWAGLAYLFLRTVHVLVDVSQTKLRQPTTSGFVAYLLFAPTLRMGPVYRYADFETQLQSDLEHTRSFRVAAGRILVGLVRLGIMAVLLKQARLDRLFGDSIQLHRLPVERMIAGLYIAPMTIYLWISGYTDLSIGVGRIMGFAVPENFHYPWVATSLADFWRRWHLTLGSWLRDYVYIPLGGNRRHVAFNYVVTFLFCGLWHGTRPAMIIWGLSQGVGLAVWRIWNHYWARQAQESTAVYRRARRLRLVESPLATALAWLLTFHYQILTINIIMDEDHAGYHIAKRILEICRPWG